MKKKEKSFKQTTHFMLLFYPTNFLFFIGLCFLYGCKKKTHSEETFLPSDRPWVDGPSLILENIQIEKKELGFWPFHVYLTTNPETDYLKVQTCEGEECLEREKNFMPLRFSPQTTQAFIQACTRNPKKSSENCGKKETLFFSEPLFSRERSLYSSHDEQETLLQKTAEIYLKQAQKYYKTFHHQQSLFCPDNHHNILIKAASLMTQDYLAALFTLKEISLSSQSFSKEPIFIFSKYPPLYGKNYQEALKILEPLWQTQSQICDFFQGKEIEQANTNLLKTQAQLTVIYGTFEQTF